MPLRGYQTRLPEPSIESSGTWPVGVRRDVPRVLLADDDPQLLRVMTRILRRAGFEVETVATAGEALDLISAIGFDLVITDLFFPQLSGARILAAVRELDPALPVVIITGAAGIGESLRKLEDPALHFIAKPFTGEELCALLGQLVPSLALQSEG